MDVFYHPLEFTVNFWVPFIDCGLDLPSLGVFCAPFEEAARYTKYDGGVDPDPGSPGRAAGWHFDRFDPAMWSLAIGEGQAFQSACESFGRVWTPAYLKGDAMMLSNWTLHFTHAPLSKDGRRRRDNVELRFTSEQSLSQILDRRAQRPLR